MANEDCVTVSELLQMLYTLPLDSPVILAKDGEGNAYSPLWTVEEGIWMPESSEVGPTPEQIEESGDPEEWYDYSDDPNAARAVILTPEF